MAPKGKKKGDEEDDEESELMPLDLVFRKLKSGTMNFGMYLTGDRDNPVLIAAHKRKPPKRLGLTAKQEAGTTKGTFGTLTLESGELLFQCETDKVPKSMQKKLKELLKKTGFMKFRPKILLPGGNELGEHDDDDDDEDEDLREVVAPGGAATKTRKGTSKSDSAEDDEDPQEAKLKEAVTKQAEKIMPDLQALADGEDGKAADKAEKLIEMIQKAVDEGNWKKALGALAAAKKLVNAGGEEAEDDAEDDAEDEEADEGGGDEIDPEKAERMKAAIAKKLRAGLN